MKDLIDREAAIDDILTVDPSAILDAVWVERWIKTLPSAQVDPCSVCRWKDEHPWSVCNGCKAEGVSE